MKPVRGTIIFNFDESEQPVKTDDFLWHWPPIMLCRVSLKHWTFALESNRLLKYSGLFKKVQCVWFSKLCLHNMEEMRYNIHIYVFISVTSPENYPFPLRPQQRSRHMQNTHDLNDRPSPFTLLPVTETDPWSGHGHVMTGVLSATASLNNKTPRWLCVGTIRMGCRCCIGCQFLWLTYRLWRQMSLKGQLCI